MNPSQHAAQRQQRLVRREAVQADSLSMFNLLTGSWLLECVEELLPAHRARLYPPTTTLAMFVAQVLSPDGSCQLAVDAAAVNQLIAGVLPASTDTGTYCRARVRLPLAPVSDLARRVGSTLARELPGWWLWRGRQVRVVGGAIVSRPDTAAN